MSEWVKLWTFRTPVDPDYGGPTSTATLWRDNLGGLVLGMDERDGEKVVLLPLADTDADDLAAAIREHRTSSRMRTADAIGNYLGAASPETVRREADLARKKLIQVQQRREEEA